MTNEKTTLTITIENRDWLASLCPKGKTYDEALEAIQKVIGRKGLTETVKAEVAA